MKKMLLSIASICLSMALYAQQDKTIKADDFVHKSSETYEYPTDPEVLKKLEQWQDQKFGVLFHWGIYSVRGTAESWGLCSEPQPWMYRSRKNAYDAPYGEFKKWYWGQAKEFNPVNFEPADWAKTMKEAGFKYLLFTTKHHDGFCMFDSKYTDYNIAQGPYKNGKYSNVAYHLFDAFRKENFMIGAYFSKADWHNEDYWDPDYATPTRNPNYDIREDPQKWAKFQQFTANQIGELMSDYGRVDVLWLDAGWVREPEQDIKIDEIVSNARRKQPGLIVADRTVAGRNENYQTPERKIPETQIAHPWESNIPLTKKWGWKEGAQCKSATWVINTLVEIVAKGGCFALGLGPKPDGTFDEEVYAVLKQTGDWLKKNGKSIYSTRITPNYHSGDVWFTADKDGRTLYAIYALPENEQLPAVIEWEGNIPDGRMVLLQNGKSVKYTCEGGKVKVTVPKGINNEALAFCFKLK